MKDIETQVITRVKSALDNELEENVKLSSVYINEPSSFPYVSISESDNYVSRYNVGDEETVSTVMYEVEVFATGDDRKTKARKIAKVIDKELYSLNFTRTNMREVPNLQNVSVYRLVMQFTADTDGHYIYRR